MLAAPASTAAPPTTKSNGSRRPAVPPPPVAGAAVGSAVWAGPGGADAGWLRCARWAGAGGGDTALLALACGEWPARGPVLAPRLETAGVGEPDRAGENEVGTADGVDRPEQAESATQKRMATMAQPMAASLLLGAVPAMVMRTLMAPGAGIGTCSPDHSGTSGYGSPALGERPGRNDSIG